MSAGIREIEKAREWLGREWLSAMFEDGAPSPESKKLWERFLNRLATLFFIDTDGKVKNLSRLVSENWDGKSVYPLDLPPVLLIELAAEENALIQDLSVPVRKKIGVHLLENSAHLEELFVAFGLRDPKISKTFGDELSPLDWTEVESRLQAAKKRPRFLSWLPLRVAAFLTALLLLGKNAFSKPVTILWTAGSLAALAVGIGVVATVASPSEDLSKAPEETSLEWKFKDQMSLNMIKRGKVDYLDFQSGRLYKQDEERNIVNFFADQAKAGGYQFTGTVKSLFYNWGSAVPVLGETSSASFHISTDGSFQVNEGQKEPSIRGIPTFPHGKIKPGSVWKAPAELVIGYIDPSFQSKTEVSYTYLSNALRSNREALSWCAVIGYRYGLREDLVKSQHSSRPDQTRLFILTNEGEIIWGIQNGFPVEQTEAQRELMIENGGTGRRIHSTYLTRYDVTYPIAKSQMKKAEEEIKLALGQRKDAETYVDEKGIHVRMKEILFPFDSSSLNTTSTSVLASILPVLKKYKDYEIFVEGHTDNVGTESYNQGLSESRARSVADYLARGDSFPKLYVKGQGSKNPIADNKADEGRQLNRRVEITIRQTGDKTAETQQP